MAWQIGDLAVCVDAAPQAGDWAISSLTVGRVYTVSGVLHFPNDGADRCPDGLTLAELKPPFGRMGYCADRFRKVVRDKHEACEPEFVTLLKRNRVAA